jgi:hypothetical protein
LNLGVNKDEILNAQELVVRGGGGGQRRDGSCDRQEGDENSQRRRGGNGVKGSKGRQAAENRQRDTMKFYLA